MSKLAIILISAAMVSPAFANGGDHERNSTYAMRDQGSVAAEPAMDAWQAALSTQGLNGRSDLPPTFMPNGQGNEDSYPSN